MSRSHLSRRSFLAVTAAAPLVSAAPKPSHIPIGLELFSVRNELKQDLMGTVRTVAKMGYEGVEFFSPYFEWTPDYAKQVRALLDELNIRCFSTHNGPKSFTPEGLPHAMELNKIIGSKFIIMASAGNVKSLDDWRTIADTLTHAADQMRPQGLRTGFHNHAAEWKPIDGTMPMEVLAANTPKDFALQLDVGTCLEAGIDPVAWIEKNPGRISSVHCKDWSPEPDKGYKVLVGEGVAPWKKIIAAAEKSGGVEYYLVEQEGSAYPAFDTAARCLNTFRKFKSA